MCEHVCVCLRLSVCVLRLSSAGSRSGWFVREHAGFAISQHGFAAAGEVIV